MAARRGSAGDRAYDIRRPRMRAETTRRRASSRGPTRTLGEALILPRCDFIHRRRALGPSLREANGLAHAIEELVFAVVMLPAPAGIELQEMRASTLGEDAPFLGNRVKCMRRHSCRHGGAGSQCSWRRGTVSFATRTSNDRPLTGSLHPRHISESLGIIAVLRGTRAGAEGGRDSLVAGEAQRVGPKTDPPGRGNPGGSR